SPKAERVSRKVGNAKLIGIRPAISQEAKSTASDTIIQNERRSSGNVRIISAVVGGASCEAPIPLSIFAGEIDICILLRTDPREHIVESGKIPEVFDLQVLRLSFKRSGDRVEIEVIVRSIFPASIERHVRRGLREI